MTRVARILGLVLVLAIASARPALAAGAQTVPEPPPAPDPAIMQTMPDLGAYIAIVIPNPVATAVCESEPTGGNWFDVGFQIAHLTWQVRQLYLQLVCALVSMLQGIANGIAAGLNAIIGLINAFWRLTLYWWLAFRAWLYAGWYWFELFRAQFVNLTSYVALVQFYLSALLELAIAALTLAGQLVGQIAQLAGELVNLLGWIGGLAFGLIGLVLESLSGTSMPEQLTDTSPIYRIVRGMGEGVRDSAIGWVIYLLWGMCYVAFVAWLAKFLGVGGPSNG